MEHQKNPEIKPNNIKESKDYKDDYLATKEKIHNLKEEQKQEYVPESPIDTAHILLSDSELTSLMPEIDKEIKLANLDAIEKHVTYQFLSLWNDFMWQRKQQEKKIMEAKIKYKELFDPEGEDELLEKIEMEINEANNIFDSAGSLRKGMIIPTLSRGKYGFEREKQVQTIQNYKMENIDKSEQNPGFMQKYMGGFKK